MSLRTLTERVEALERELALLKSAQINGAEPKDWRRTVGMFTGDEVMKRIDAAALAFREADRRKARRGGSRNRHKKP